MAKDPAVLFYISDWLRATKGMKADVKGWYLNLILFQFDKGDLPNDIEELANLCDVRFSEYAKFEQVFEQVLKQKFKQNENGRLENDNAKDIIQKREAFKEKRTNAGKWGYLIKFLKAHFNLNFKQIEFIKSTINLDEIDLKNEQMLKQVLEQKLKLYINENENEDIYNNAYDYLKEKCAEDLEAFEMKNKKSFPDYNLFIQNFNSKVTIERLPYIPKILFARLDSLNGNWDKNKKGKEIKLMHTSNR